MATVEVCRLAAPENDPGRAVVEFTIDDTNLRLTQITVTNTAQRTFRVTLIQEDNRRTFTRDFAPGVVSINVPTNPNGRMVFTRDAQNRFDNMDKRFGWV